MCLELQNLSNPNSCINEEVLKLASCSNESDHKRNSNNLLLEYVQYLLDINALTVCMIIHL